MNLANLIKKFDRRFILATFATTSASICTVIFLFIIKYRTDNDRLLHIYSAIGMVSGWMNNAVTYLAPRYLNFQKKKYALLFYILSIIFVEVIIRVCFAIEWNIWVNIFEATLLIPVLFVNRYSIHYSIGDAIWSYRRLYTLNSSFILMAFLAFIFSHSVQDVYKVTLFFGISLFIYWLVDATKDSIISTPHPKSYNIYRILANPVIPVLDRVIWDQVVLNGFKIGSLNFSLYVIGRIISFSGSVLTAYFLNRSLEKNSIPKKWTVFWGIMLFLFIAQIFLNGPYNVQITFILGQIFAWLLSSTMMLYFMNQSRKYEYFTIVWAVDFICRIIMYNKGSIDLYVYFIKLQIVVLSIISIYLILKNEIKNKTITS